MRIPIRMAIAAAMFAALAACTSLGSQEAQRYYVLEVPAGRTGVTASARAATLLVAPVTASSFYETEQIAYSRAPGTRAYYQLNSWTELPNQRMTELLARRLERAGSFKTVTSTIGGTTADIVLSAHLSEFYHDAAGSPGRVRVTMTADLINPRRRELLARRTFEQSVPAESYDAAGAAQAFGVAVAAMLDDIAAWVEVSAPR